jgi:hypothetical protein
MEIILTIFFGIIFIIILLFWLNSGIHKINYDEPLHCYFCHERGRIYYNPFDFYGRECPICKGSGYEEKNF